MGITVRILIHELEKRYGKVLAGEARLKRQCADVRLLGDAPCASTFLYVADPATAKAHALDEGRAIVLAVGPEAVPARNQLALRSSVPMLEVFAFLQDTFSRYRAWLEEMDRSLIRDEGLQGLFDVSEEFLINNTIIVDPALKLLAYTKGIDCGDDPVTRELIKHGYHTEENIRKFQLNQRFEPWATQNGFIINDSKTICNYTTAVYSFKAAGSFSLIVVMACNNVAPEPWLLDTFMMFLVRVAYYSMRDYTDGSPSGSAFNAFIHDILDGSLSDEEEIEERRRYLGIPADGPFCLFDIDVAASRHLAARIVTDVARAIAPAKAMLRGSEIAVLCFSCHGLDCPIGVPLEGCPSGGANVTKRLETVLTDYGLQAGRSVRFDKLSFLPTALEQAHLALRTARALQQGVRGEGAPGARDGGSAGGGEGSGGAAQERIFGFDELHFDYGALTVSRGQRELLTSLRGCRQLMRIRDYDRLHGTDNFDFLRQYLRYERRTTVVAEKLHMHRNNVKYRVDRLAELFRVDTDSDSERLELSIAYRLLDSLDR